MEEKEIQKPLILEINEAKIELVQWANHTMKVRKLPCYIIDMILSDLGYQIKEGAKDELDMAMRQVQEQQNDDGEVA